MAERDRRGARRESGALTVELRQLERKDVRLRCAGEAEKLGLRLAPLKVRGPVEVDAELSRRGQLVLARGEVRGKAERRCARCLKVFIEPFRASLDVQYRREPEKPLDRELELTADEADTVYYDGETLDLSAEVREAALLAEPMRALCRPDCRGLCAGCGVDLNRGACRCPEKPGDSRWDALKRWKSS